MSGSLCCSLSASPPKLYYRTCSGVSAPTPNIRESEVAAGDGGEANVRLGVCTRVLPVQFKGTWCVCIRGVILFYTCCWLLQ